MRRAWLVALLLFGCRERGRDIQRAPERELPRLPPPAPSATVTSLVGHVGEQVTVSGVLDPAARPRIPWTVPGKSSALVALEGSALRIVVHAAKAPSCPGAMVLRGEVIVARGMIRHGTTEGDYAEPQLDVTEWSCR